MKFDNLFKLIVNSKIITEAEASEDSKELGDDPLLGSSPSDIGSSVSDIGGDIDDLAADSPVSDPMSFSPEEKVEYLLKHSQIINKNPNWTDNDKRAKAEYIVNNDLFDAFVEPIEARLSAQAEEPEAQALDELPPELDSDIAGPDDLEDIRGGLDSESELRRRETEDQEEGMPD